MWSQDGETVEKVALPHFFEQELRKVYPQFFAELWVKIS